ERDAALAAIDIPNESAPHARHPVARVVRRLQLRRAACADSAVAPDSGWSRRRNADDRDDRCERGERRRRNRALANREDDREQTERREEQRDESPAARRGKQRQQTETAGERARNRADRV